MVLLGLGYGGRVSFFFFSLSDEKGVVMLTDSKNRAQWSYKKGMAAGVLPQKAYEREFNCDLSKIPSFSDLPETY